MGSGGLVLSERVKAAEDIFVDDEVMWFDDYPESFDAQVAKIQAFPELKEECVKKATEKIMECHTYKHRCRTMLDRLGI